MILATDITPTDLTICIVLSFALTLSSCFVQVFAASAPTAPSGRLDADALPTIQAGAEFSWHGLNRTVAPDDARSSCRSVLTTGQPPWSARTAIRKKGDIALS